MIIAPERLSHEALLNIIHEFIAREGTDYGEIELGMQAKIDALKPQIMSGEVLIVFDENTQSVNLIPRRDV